MCSRIKQKLRAVNEKEYKHALKNVIKTLPILKQDIESIINLKIQSMHNKCRRSEGRKEKISKGIKN